MSVSPAGVWHLVAGALGAAGAKRPLKAQLQAELAAAADETAAEEIRAAFQAREEALEHDIDHKPMEVHLGIGISYKCCLAPLARVATPLRVSPVPPPPPPSNTGASFPSETTS